MGFNIGPKVLTAFGGGVSRTGNYKVHQYPPSIVNDDSLEIYYDFGNPDCFDARKYASGNVTSVKDLSKSGYDGSIHNLASPLGYYATNGGSLVFDGSNDYVNTGVDFSFGDHEQKTIELWFKPATITDHGRCILGKTVYEWGFYQYNAQFRFVYWDVSGGHSNGGGHSQDNFLEAGVWCHATVVWDHTNVRKSTLYKNGEYMQHTGWNQDNKGGSANRNHSNNVQLGRGYNWFSGTGIGGDYWNGNIAIFRMYNRALSADEVLQNHNAEKIRFLANATNTDDFTPRCNGGNGRVEVLTVAGGGGGAFGKSNGNGSGGGGAGGLLYNNAYSVTESAVSVKIGAGGTGGLDNSTRAYRGGDSVFGTMTAIGGGGGGQAGGSGSVSSPLSGGSGGGGGAAPGNNGTTGQGFPGGAFYNASGYYRGGGGGGASAEGTSGYWSGTGGAGRAFSITGKTQYYAGGGGGAGHSGYSSQAGAKGGLGGSGVGGWGADGDGTSTTADFGGNAVPNTGSGGGGATWPSTSGTECHGGNGSNGVVIVRYPTEDYNVELLVVGGGGGGGSASGEASAGGGGGAGGLIHYASIPVSSGKN